jgi:hypothetical protein
MGNVFNVQLYLENLQYSQSVLVEIMHRNTEKCVTTINNFQFLTKSPYWLNHVEENKRHKFFLELVLFY